MSKSVTLNRDLFVAIYEEFLRSDAEFIPLSMNNMCCFIIAPFEFVCMDIIHADMTQDMFIVSVSTDGIDYLMNEPFGSIHNMMGTFKFISNSIDKVMLLLQAAKFKYQAKVKKRFDAWEVDKGSLQKYLGLEDDMAYTKFLLEEF